MRRSLSLIALTVLLGLCWVCTASAATVHMNDRTGPTTFTKLADGSVRASGNGFVVTYNPAEAQQFADLVKPDPAPQSDTLFQSSLTQDCTMDAFWTHPDLGVSENPDWFCESGNNIAGHVVEGVYRQWTRRTDLQNYRVTLQLRLKGFNSLRSDAVAGWNGFKLWLHRKLQTPGPGGRVDDGSTAGYTAEPALRDGRVYVQKKVGDLYCVLSATPSFPYPLGGFHEVGGEVRNNADGSVTVSVLRDGLTLVSATDRGQCLGPPLRGPGRVGLRGDNVDMAVRDLTVTGL